MWGFGKHQCGEFSTSQVQVKALSMHSLTLYTQEDQAALWLPWHCTTNTAQGAFPKHSDPTEFHTCEFSLFMELSLPFPPSYPVSGYTWWSWRIILSNLPINNEVGEQQLYLSEYSTWRVQLSQHNFQQPFCPAFLPGQHYLYIFTP